MSGSRPDTVYCKRVIQMLCDEGHYVDKFYVDYAKNLTDSEEFEENVWFTFMEDFNVLMNIQLEVSPELSAQLLAKLTECLTKGAAEPFLVLMNSLVETGNLCRFCVRAHDNEDALYALATFFTMNNHSIETQADLSSALESLLQKHVALGEHTDDWNDLLAAAFFGPAWATLYHDELHGVEDDIIESVWIQRPPLVNRTHSLSSSARSPLDMC